MIFKLQRWNEQLIAFNRKPDPVKAPARDSSISSSEPDNPYGTAKSRCKTGCAAGQCTHTPTDLDRMYTTVQKIRTGYVLLFNFNLNSKRRLVSLLVQHADLLRVTRMY